jgi:hypothetical protein
MNHLIKLKDNNQGIFGLLPLKFVMLSFRRGRYYRGTALISRQTVKEKPSTNNLFAGE